MAFSALGTVELSEPEPDTPPARRPPPPAPTCTVPVLRGLSPPRRQGQAPRRRLLDRPRQPRARRDPRQGLRGQAVPAPPGPSSPPGTGRREARSVPPRCRLRRLRNSGERRLRGARPPTRRQRAAAASRPHQRAKRMIAITSPTVCRPITTQIASGIPARSGAEQGRPERQAEHPRGERRAEHPGDRPDDPAPAVEEAVGEEDREDGEEDADRDQLDQRRAPEDRSVHQQRKPSSAAEFFGRAPESPSIFVLPALRSVLRVRRLRRRSDSADSASPRDFFDFAAQFFDLAFERPEFFPGRFARRRLPAPACRRARAAPACPPALPARSAPAAPAPTRSPRSARRPRSPGR